MSALAWMAVGATIAVAVVAWLEHDRRRQAWRQSLARTIPGEPPAGVRPALYDQEAEDDG